MSLQSGGQELAISMQRPMSERPKYPLSSMMQRALYQSKQFSTFLLPLWKIISWKTFKTAILHKKQALKERLILSSGYGCLLIFTAHHNILCHAVFSFLDMANSQYRWKWEKVKVYSMRQKIKQTFFVFTSCTRHFFPTHQSISKNNYKTKIQVSKLAAFEPFG